MLLLVLQPQLDDIEPVSIERSGDLAELSPNRQLVIYRTVQEALTNTARHSAAKILRVDMSMQANRLHIALQDDGKLRGALREGNGLTGMRERIEERSGSLSLTRGPHGGLRLDVMLPA